MRLRKLPWWLLPPVAVGALLRLWNLGAQVMSDDEMHAVKAALSQPVREILVTYPLVDSSIPLTALYRLLVDCGLRLSEWTFRMPSLAAGLLALIVLPLPVERRLGRLPATAFAWLLALSPGLVFYSRIARSYLPVVLVAAGAVVAFEVFWRSARWRWGVLYSTLAAVATWLHLGAATFVVAPFLFAAGDLLTSGWDRRRATRLAALGLLTTLAFLTFLAPARDSLFVLVRDKHQSLGLSWWTVGAVLKLQAGATLAATAALFWLAAAAGLARLARLDRRLAAYTATVVVGHLVGLLVLSPTGHRWPLVFNRYLLVALPVVLLWVAVGLAIPWPTKSRVLQRVGPVLATVLVLALLALTGPFADRSIWHTSFAHSNDHLNFHRPRPELVPELSPSFYRRLAASPDGSEAAAAGAVIEFPWLPVWRLNQSFYLYQEVHGRDVMVAPLPETLADARLAFRNLTASQPAALLASRGRWLVVHRNLGGEEDRLREPEAYQAWPRERNPPHDRTHNWRLCRAAARRLGGQLKKEWGPPDYADRQLRVWDLERVRRQLAIAPAVPAVPAEYQRRSGEAELQE